MTKENEELRNKVKDIEGIAVNCLHSQPEDDSACNRMLAKTLAKIADITSDYLGIVEVEAYDIQWDTDGEDVFLPSSVKMMVMQEADMEDVISDRLSDEFGWCITGFRWRIV